MVIGDLGFSEIGGILHLLLLGSGPSLTVLSLHEVDLASALDIEITILDKPLEK